MLIDFSGRWKYIAFGQNGHRFNGSCGADCTYLPQLFDVDADPAELKDVAKAQPNVASTRASSPVAPCFLVCVCVCVRVCVCLCVCFWKVACVFLWRVNLTKLNVVELEMVTLGPGSESGISVMHPRIGQGLRVPMIGQPRDRPLAVC